MDVPSTATGTIDSVLVSVGDKVSTGVTGGDNRCGGRLAVPVPSTPEKPDAAGS